MPMKSVFKNLLAVCLFLQMLSVVAVSQDVAVGLTKSGEDDKVENFTFPQIVKINFSGNIAELSAAPAGVTVNGSGAKVNINSEIEGLELILSGSSPNGAITINSSKKIKLTLNGVNLANSNGPAINILSGKRTFVVLNSGTNNTLVVERFIAPRTSRTRERCSPKEN